MCLNNIDLFVEATNHIKCDVIGERLYFSASDIYKFITKNKSMPGAVHDKLDIKYVSFIKVNSKKLSGPKHFTYALTFEDAIRFIDLITNKKIERINTTKSVLIGQFINFLIDNPNISSKGNQITKLKNIVELL